MRLFAINLIYIFVNYFVNYIPVWTIRKLIYRCVGMKIGKGTRINMRCVILAPWKIRIGENTMINEYTLLDGRGGLILEITVPYRCGALYILPAIIWIRQPLRTIQNRPPLAIVVGWEQGVSLCREASLETEALFQ